MNSRKAANDKISTELGSLSRFEFSDMISKLTDRLEFICSRPMVYNDEEEALAIKAENDEGEVVEGRFCLFCDCIGEEEGHYDECPIFEIRGMMSSNDFVKNYTWEK